MKRMSGLKLLEEREGAGMPARKGDRIVYNFRIFLNQGGEVPSTTFRPRSVLKSWCEWRGE